MKKPSKELIKEWYDKAAESGFDDIEVFDRNMEPSEIGLKKAASTHAFNISNRTSVLELEAFFIQARRWVHIGNFDTEQDLKIWELFSEGTPQRKIAALLDTKRHRVSTSIEKSTANMLEAGNQSD